MFSSDTVSNWIQHIVRNGTCTRCGKQFGSDGIIYQKKEGHILTITPAKYEECKKETL